MERLYVVTVAKRDMTNPIAINLRGNHPIGFVGMDIVVDIWAEALVEEEGINLLVQETQHM